MLKYDCRGRTLQYSDTIWRIGNCCLYWLLTHGSLDVDVGFTPVNVVKFWRLEKQKSLYYSKEYTRTSKINNYTILYDQDGTEKFGFIKYFLELQRITNNTSEFFVIAIIDELCTAPFVRGSVIIPHLHTIVSIQQSDIIPVANIRLKCILIDIPGENQIISHPYDFCAQLSL